jgi:hypothetical protein
MIKLTMIITNIVVENGPIVLEKPKLEFLAQIEKGARTARLTRKLRLKS